MKNRLFFNIINISISNFFLFISINNNNNSNSNFDYKCYKDNNLKLYNISY